MKVQTGDDAKHFPATTTDDKSPIVVNFPVRTTQSASDSEFPFRANYVNFSKTCLLFLAIIATFLACLLFTRDLLAKKDGLSRHHVPHPEYLTTTPNTELASTDRFFDDNLITFPRRLNPIESKPIDENDSNTITRITLRIKPNEEPSVSSGESAETPFISSMFDDMMKMIMNMENVEDNDSKQSTKMETVQPNNVQPKLIIIRKIQQSPISSFNEDSLPLVPKVNNFDEASTRMIDNRRLPFPFGMSPMFPMFRLLDDMMKNESMNNNSTTEDSGAQSWSNYRKIISKMATSIDSLVEETDELKNKLEKTIVSYSNAKVTDDGSKLRLKRALSNMSAIVNYLTEISVSIKTEDGALDLINKEDKQSLNATIDSFLKTAQRPLNALISQTTELSRFNENNQNDDLHQAIGHFVQSVLDFGRLFSSELHELTRSLKESTVNKMASEEASDSLDRPVVHRKMWFFKSPVMRFYPLQRTQIAEPIADEKFRNMMVPNGST